MIRLAIEGMTCGHCVAHVKAALEAVPGVVCAEVVLRLGEARVEGAASPEALCVAVGEVGYAARVAE